LFALKASYIQLSFVRLVESAKGYVLENSVRSKSALVKKRAAIADTFEKSDKLIPIYLSVAAEKVLFVNEIVIAHVTGNDFVAECVNKVRVGTSVNGKKMIYVEANAQTAVRADEVKHFRYVMTETASRKVLDAYHRAQGVGIFGKYAQ
jgi:hypothetical protein